MLPAYKEGSNKQVPYYFSKNLIHPQLAIFQESLITLFHHCNHMSWERQRCCPFTLEQIRTATNNFASVIGRGGFGNVYLGHINNQDVAIKRHDLNSAQGEVEFKAEIYIGSEVRHCRLLSPIGYCKEDDEMILVYEYMPQGSLHDNLYRDDAIHHLPWEVRLKICMGVADGLHHLHEGIGFDKRILHVDVKSSNIMLDNNFNAKISDFGLSKIAPAHTDIDYVVQNTLKFSKFYADPRYLKTGILSKESDVYSFGKVLLEVMCGKKAFSQQVEDGISQGRLDDIIDSIVDPRLEGQALKEDLLEFSSIALQCLSKKRYKRPVMSVVLVMLHNLYTSISPVASLQDSSDIQSQFSIDNGRSYDISQITRLPSRPQVEDNFSNEIRNVKAYSEGACIAGPSRIRYKPSSYIVKHFGDQRCEVRHEYLHDSTLFDSPIALQHVPIRNVKTYLEEACTAGRFSVSYKPPSYIVRHFDKLGCEVQHGNLDDSNLCDLPIDSQPVTVKCFTQLPAVAASESISSFPVLVGVQAPTLKMDDDNEQKHLPIDLVMVLDVSGSMRGEKLRHLKSAVGLVVKKLGPHDRLSIVKFSDNAEEIFPLRWMREEGRKDATFAVNSLWPEGKTNILEGLRKGVHVLEERWMKNSVTSMILLSDGKDTCGVTKECLSLLLPASVCQKDNEKTRSGDQVATIPVHTFGFGTDHDPALMHAISDASAGTFSFIQLIAQVQDAFDKCIGGLLGVVAQHVQLTLTSISPGVQIDSISSGRYSNEIYGKGHKAVIDVGDLCTDEEKDFLVCVSVPAVRNSSADPDEEKGVETKTSLLDVLCSFKYASTNRITNPTHQVNVGRVEIRRPEACSAADRIASVEVDQQKNRLWVVESIKEAQAMAKEGDLEGARDVITRQRSHLQLSTSARATNGSSMNLESELIKIQDGMRSMQLYEKEGRAYAYAILSSHSHQRANSVPLPRDGSFQYGNDIPTSRHLVYGERELLSTEVTRDEDIQKEDIQYEDIKDEYIKEEGAGNQFYLSD